MRILQIKTMWYLHSSYILLNAFDYHVTTSLQVPITVSLQLQCLRWTPSLKLLEGASNQDTGSFRINILPLRFTPSDYQQQWIEVWNPRSCVQYRAQKGPWQLWKLCWQSAKGLHPQEPQSPTRYLKRRKEREVLTLSAGTSRACSWISARTEWRKISFASNSLKMSLKTALAHTALHSKERW